jgi:hypothetical protein
VLRTGDEDAAPWKEQYAELRLAVIARKHATVVKMRDNGEIDDEVPCAAVTAIARTLAHSSRRQSGSAGRPSVFPPPVGESEAGRRGDSAGTGDSHKARLAACGRSGAGPGDRRPPRLRPRCLGADAARHGSSARWSFRSSGSRSR